MKKVFTLLAAAFASASMWAADFQLYFGDEQVVDGATYTCPGYVLNEDGSYTDKKGNNWWEWYQDADLFVQGAAGTGLTIEVVTNGELQVCSLDGLCVIASEAKSVEKSGTLTGTKESLQIHTSAYTKNDEPLSEALKPITFQLSAYQTGDLATKVSITVVLPAKKAEEGGISSATSATAYKMVGNTLSYSVERPATLSIYAITGTLAAKHQIANSGNINLSHLPKGIYIYTDGTRKGKIIVR